MGPELIQQAQSVASIAQKSDPKPKEEANKLETKSIQSEAREQARNAEGVSTIAEA